MMSFFRSTTSTDTEENEVKKLLQNSYNFKKLTQLYNIHKDTNLNDIKNIVESLQTAKTFHDITSALRRFDPNDVDGAANWFEAKAIPPLMHGFTFFAGFINDNWNVIYYSINLFNEALNNMTKFPQYSDYLSKVILFGNNEVLRANSMFYEKR